MLETPPHWKASGGQVGDPYWHVWTRAAISLYYRCLRFRFSAYVFFVMGVNTALPTSSLRSWRAVVLSSWILDLE